MKLGKYAPLMMAVCISLILIGVAGLSVRFIYNYDRANVSHHILTRLQATHGMIDLWQHNFLSGTRALADDPGLIRLVDNLINNKVTPPEASKSLDEWLRPIYLGRGYDGHSIISPDYIILLSSSPTYTGKSVVSPASREAIAQAMGNIGAISHPIEAKYQISMHDGVAEAGTLFQLGCASINRNGKLLAVLCLRQNPYRNFFAMLSSGFSGSSGESYAVDNHGNIITPTRFGSTLINPKIPAAKEPAYIKGLQVRVPSKTRNGVLVTNPKTSPITRAVSLAMRNGESGFVDGYLDYRGAEVVGAVKWIPELNMGIVIEQDADEVYAPFRFYCNVIIGFTTLAILLINLLMFVMVRSRKSLAEREQSMRAFLDNLPGLAHMRDREGNFVIANKQMESLLHIPRKRIIGHNDDILLLPQKHIRQLQHDHDEVLRTGQILEAVRDISDVNYEQVEWVKTIRFPIFDTDTKEICAVGTILLNITEQIRNARELDTIRVNLENRVAERTAQFETARLEAEQAAQVKADFLANMSHEIRTPMNAIIGLSHLATLVSDDPKLRGYLERIHQSSTHLLSIINDILDFSKIEAGKMTIEHADFSLEDMLDNVLGLLWDKADTKGLELLLHIDADLPNNLKGDALRLGQILINFTSNAVKFTEAGHVLVRVTKVSETSKKVRVCFAIQDTGIGISTEQFSQLFTPFHQLDTSSTRRFEGTGLGLAISKNLIELMDGELSISSEPQRGSTFSVTLNLTKGTLQKNQNNNAVWQGKHALVVDDNPLALQILTTLLSTMGVQVSQADSGAAALAMLQSNTSGVDFIFIDWRMHGISGFETAEHIRALEQASGTQLILLCSHNKQDLDANAEQIFDAMLSKPVLASALRNTLTGLCKNNMPAQHATSAIDLSNYRKLSGSKVLLVDDNQINQDVVKELLSLLQVHIVTAGNGQEALEYLVQESFDLVLMDVQMPVMDGMEATRKLRAQARFDQLPIIAMTAGALEGDRERCLNVGMNDYISKPIYPETLFNILLRWHKQSRSATPARVETITTRTSGENIYILSQLKRIPGLEVDQALERLLNNETLYLKLAARFLQERNNIVDIIETALAAGNTNEASSQAHSFKSLAGTLGAVELQQLALQIEMDLQQKKDISHVLQKMREGLNELFIALQRALES